MNQEAYARISHWSLSTQLIEIQQRVEGSYLLAHRLRDGHTVDPKRDIDKLTKDLAEWSSWLAQVREQHAPDAPPAASE